MPKNNIIRYPYKLLKAQCIYRHLKNRATNTTSTYRHYDERLARKREAKRSKRGKTAAVFHRASERAAARFMDMIVCRRHQISTNKPSFIRNVLLPPAEGVVWRQHNSRGHRPILTHRIDAGHAADRHAPKSMSQQMASIAATVRVMKRQHLHLRHQARRDRPLRTPL